MECRTLPHGGERISVLGMGSSVIGAKPSGRRCRRCHPCPAGLDIALINKYYDLAQLGDKLAKEHYLTLEKTAGDCIGCGHCDSRFPFHVAQSERMQTIRAYFGA